ncbi:putative nwd2 protein [Mycena sanguinolenta]|uniref:Putative nwd2 protein n=1 Tax=Mycena sanguinolenta TaxID=230812 RepID=A0A8H7DH53_9AGAR|nr:putative nwd2 protein [Mycena sanguinolenta]
MLRGVHTMNNYINGGRGGAGGGGYGSGTGGAGGQGMGPSLNFDIQSSGNITVNNMQQRERGIDILHHAVALEAIHNSAESYPQPRCHPETRTKMLEDLRKWVLGTHTKRTILWLYGPAGAGKSAIMQTLAGQLKDAGIFGGSFFFRRGHATRGNAKTLFATIAYQLALSVASLRIPISQIVESDPSIVALSIEEQMRNLISEPCHSNRIRNPVVVLIDGLDECEGQNIQVEILRIIRQSSPQDSNFLHFIIASRPEPHIHETFDSPFYSGHCRSVNVEQSFADVHKYLRDEFSRIHREHSTMARIPLPWPSSDELQQLVWNSSGHFIYAATIIKFIDDKSHRPTKRLAVVQDPNGSSSESAFDTLDQLYMTILRSAPRQSQLIPIMCAIVHFQFRLAVGEIDKLFGLAQGETRLLLRGVHSVLDVPSYDGGRISLHHASFVDFLSNPDRSGNFCVGILNNQVSLARSLLQYYAGPFQRHHISTLSNLNRFIVSLPSCSAVAELFPLIGSINPDYISHAYWEDNYELESFVFWLQNFPLAATDLNHVIELWEDYAYMLAINKTHWWRANPSVKHIVWPSPELLYILISMGFLRCRLWELPTRLDSTWIDLRTTLCSLRPQLAGDEHIIPVHQPHTAPPWAARDLALHLIHKMVKNHTDTEGGINPAASQHAVRLYSSHSFFSTLEEAYTQSQSGFGGHISLLVRLSPPCPVLYRELWSIPPSEIWSSQSCGDALIHHTSKWLESFPDSTRELIALWQQAVPDPKFLRTNTLNPAPIFIEENWCYRVGRYNDMIARLHLPDILKFPL